MQMSFSLVVLAVIYCTVESTTTPPVVNVYSRDPGKYGEPNTLICHVSQFNPPDISIEILKNGVELPGATLKDLAFDGTWQFHLTKSVPFTPAKGDAFICKVTHEGRVSNYAWEADM